MRGTRPLDVRDRMRIRGRQPPTCRGVLGTRFRAKREQTETVRGLLPESHGQNLALAISYVPYRLDSGWRVAHTADGWSSRLERTLLEMYAAECPTSHVYSAE